MGEWVDCKLEDVLTLQRGHDLPKSEMVEGNIPVAGSNGIIGWHNKATSKAVGVTIGRSGNLGNAFLHKKDFWAHNTTLYVKDFKGNSPEFVYYLLKTIDFKQFNVGSAVPTLNRNHIHPLDIIFPKDEDEQKAIAEVLSSLDDKIDLLHRQNKTLESLAETLFRQYFIENAQDDWEEKPISYFGDVVCGKTPSKSNSDYFGEDFPFIKIPDMHGKSFVNNTADALSILGEKSQPKKTIPPLSICVSCIATVGLVTMNVLPSQTNQQINSIIPNKVEFRYYLYFNMKFLYETLVNMASGGTATPNLNTGDFSRINISFPAFETIKRFHMDVEELFKKILASYNQIQKLEKLRDILLPKLMNGDIRVEE